jgi:hypothetical protein
MAMPKMEASSAIALISEMFEAGASLVADVMALLLSLESYGLPLLVCSRCSAPGPMVRWSALADVENRAGRRRLEPEAGARDSVAMPDGLKGEHGSA